MNKVSPSTIWDNISICIRNPRSITAESWFIVNFQYSENEYLIKNSLL